MHFLQRRILLAVVVIVRHPWITLGVVLLTVVATSLSAVAWLTISTDQNKLFSPKPWFFHDYLEFIGNFPENEAIYVVIEPHDPRDHPPVGRWTAVADQITDRLTSPALSRYVADAYCRVPLDELGRQGILFESAALLPREFQDARERFVPLARIWGEAPDVQTGLLGRTPIERFLGGVGLGLTGMPAAEADQTAGFVKNLADSWTAAVRDPALPLRVGAGVPDIKRDVAGDPERLGYFYVQNEADHSQHRILIRVYKKSDFNSLTSVARQVDAIRDAAVDAGKDFPEFKIGVTGRPALEADQMRTTDEDSHKAEIVALIVVFVGMVVMLRSVWLALAAEIALGVGIGWTFGWATLTEHELNLLSVVFLIALIGIGMDYLVQILTRYRLEVRRYSRPTAVWVRVFKHVGPPINTACLGAAGAFFVAVFTAFRGAAELGVIAGGGLILCLIAGYTALPALLTIFPPKFKPFDVSRRYRPARMDGPVSLILPGIWVCLLAFGSYYMPLAHFDPGLINLQVPNLESVKLIGTLQTWMAVVLSENPEELRQVRAAVADLPVVASTESVLNVEDNAQWLREHADQMPRVQWVKPAPIAAGDLPGLAQKARNLARLFDSPSPADDARAAAGRSLLDFAKALEGSSASSAAARVSEWQNVFVGELQDLLEQFRPGPLDMKAVPVQLRSHYVGSDGKTYALYIYPSKNLWDDAKLDQFESSVEAAVKKVPGAPRVTGIASNVYHTTGAIHEAFFQSTEYALALIFVLVLLDFRRLGHTLAAISVLAMGLPMLVALMGKYDTSWNFANFFGLPILIGAGHEYGVFMVHRYLEAKKDPRRAWRRWDVSDRALLLCAFITTTSFGFFWLLAEHQGLKSLGMVMGLGTLCIYLATIMMLRPILRWRLARSSGSHGRGDEPATAR